MIKTRQITLLSLTLIGLFACTPKQETSPEKPQIGYLKNEISQAELGNVANFKRYSYVCQNFDTGSISYLTTYFPQWRESRLAENFGIYFQLDGGKAEPFDHIENRPLNAAATRFEVRYRSYYPIQGSYVELKAREKSSIYYKNGQKWLECQES